MTNYAYIRVSTEHQSYNRQFKQLNDFIKNENIEIKPENIISEKRTGKNLDRPMFTNLVSKLQKGDCLILAELSRLGRTYQNTKKIWNELTSKGVDIVVIDFPLLDTRNKENDNITSIMLTDIIFSVLNYLTDKEHQQIIERTQTGREVAKAKGVKFGRKELTKNELPKEFITAYTRHKDTLKAKDIQAIINADLRKQNKKEISRATYYNYINLLAS